LIKKKINNFFSGHQRSVKAKKNIIASLTLKGTSILISLVLVPLTINYLSPSRYGVWITLTSVIAWFNFFDIGLGNGLRNKFAIAKAEGNDELARVYVSTTYAILTIISIALFGVFIIANHFLNWNRILNVSLDDVYQIEKLIFIVFSVFCFQFVVKLINTVFLADQRSAMSSTINTVGSLMSLIVVFVLMKTTNGSLLYLGASFSIINLIVPLLASIWFFNTSYKKYKPSLRFVNLKYAKDLLSLGGAFFLGQCAALIVFSTDNMIITQLYGPEEVVPYSIALKYFSVVNVGFTIVVSTLWTAYTEAYYQKDFAWIKRVTKKAMKSWFLVLIVLVLMLFVSNNVYSLWVGNKIKVPFLLSFFMACWVGVSSGASIYGNFVTGIGKMRLALCHSVFVAIVNIPLSIYLASNFNLGVSGVILATFLGEIPLLILLFIQYKKIINGTAKGIWNR